MPLYYLDSNVFIQAKNGPYGFDIVPRFWSWIEEEVQRGSVRAPWAVLDELRKDRDELAQWARTQANSGLFVQPTPQAQALVGNMGTFVREQYSEANASEFMAGADPWLICQAKTDGAMIVTHEVAVGPGSAKIKIPNLCAVDTFHTAYCTLYEMMRQLGARFA